MDRSADAAAERTLNGDDQAYERTELRQISQGAQQNRGTIATRASKRFRSVADRSD